MSESQPPPGEQGDRFADVAHALEHTINKAARQADERKTDRARRWRDRPGAVDTSLTVVRVEPSIWAVALTIAEHPRNIQIINETEVVVWNHGPPWPDERKAGNV